MPPIRLDEVVRQAQLPGSQMIPAEQALRPLLALQRRGQERQSQVMDLVDDQGLALFAGLNVVPKRSDRAASSGPLDDRRWSRRSTRARLIRTW